MKTNTQTPEQKLQRMGQGFYEKAVATNPGHLDGIYDTPEEDGLYIVQPHRRPDYRSEREWGLVLRQGSDTVRLALSKSDGSHPAVRVVRDACGDDGTLSRIEIGTSLHGRDRGLDQMLYQPNVNPSELRHHPDAVNRGSERRVPSSEALENAAAILNALRPAVSKRVNDRRRLALGPKRTAKRLQNMRDLKS